MSIDKDYLLDDPKITNQTWACVSFLTPELVKGCNIRSLKVRGIYGVEDRATDRCTELNKNDPNFSVYKVEVGKWVAWLDNKDSNLNANDELNKLMKFYKKDRNEARLNHSKRVDRLKKKTSIIENEMLNNEEKVENTENIKIENNDIKIENNDIKIDSIKDENKIKYLTEDEPIPNQKFYCISFLVPEDYDNNSELFNVRGFKIRGVYDTENKAKEQCEKLYTLDSDHNTYVADMGHWVPWTDDPDKAENFEYSNKDLNNLMKSHKENQEKAKTFNEHQKNEMIKDSLKEVNTNSDNEITDIVDNIIDESLDDDINIKEVELLDNYEDDSEDDLNIINKELDDAKELYKKLLLEQKN